MAKKKAARTIVAEPLTPALLEELGAVRKFHSTPRDFKPDRSWANTYRIWTCHGYRESGNEDVGLLRIERTAGASKETFTLRAMQKVVQTDGISHTIDAVAECLNDQLASPRQWCLSSRFYKADADPQTGLFTYEHAVVKGNTVNIETGGRKLTRRLSNPATSDWSLFEAVQRLSFDPAVDLSFDLLEGLSIPKQSQRLKYRQTQTFEFGQERIKLHAFTHIGRGILPTEYYLDESHRLQFVCSMNKAYILDHDAWKAIRQEGEQMRK